MSVCSKVARPSVFSGGFCPGLIEAACHSRPTEARSRFPGVFAPASLKRAWSMPGVQPGLVFGGFFPRPHLTLPNGRANRSRSRSTRTCCQERYPPRVSAVCRYQIGRRVFECELRSGDECAASTSPVQFKQIRWLTHQSVAQICRQAVC